MGLFASEGFMQTSSEHHIDSKIISLYSDKATATNAFELLVENYSMKLYWHIRRIVIDHDDANDVTQNTFIKIWDSLSSFRQEAKLYTWMYRIATNEALQFLQKKKANRFISIDDLQEEMANRLPADIYFNGNEIQLKLQQAILTLPEKQRIVFNMKYFGNIKYEEMAEILDTSVGALKASYHHAVKKIELFLK